MLLHFSKMHGLGNDFMVLDLITQKVDNLSSSTIKRWSNRNTGIGFDQLLIVEASNQKNIDFNYRIFNADGSEVEQCGNGARCLALFVINNKLTTQRSLRVQTLSRIITINILDNQKISVQMGVPQLAPDDIPFLSKQQATTYKIFVNNQPIELSAISMGNPHAVLLVEDINTAPVTLLGPLVETHKSFPQKVNVGFLQIIDKSYGKLRVWERGVGETQACGTGACAAAVAAITQGLMLSPVHLELPGGMLSIEWDQIDQPVVMIGEAIHVYEGSINYD